MDLISFKRFLPNENNVAEQIQNLNFAYHVLNYDFPELHTHVDYWEFTILTEGTIINVINGETQVYKKGTLFFLTDKDCHYTKKKGTEPIRYINLMVKKDFLENYLNAISPDFCQTLKNGGRSFPLHDSVIYNIENAIHKANLLSQSELKARNDLIFSAVMLVIQSLFSAHVRQTAEIQKDWQIKLDSLLAQSNFLTMTTFDLCKELNYSKAQLNRIFKKNFNLSPHEFLQKHKFRYAQNLLSFSDMKIIEIATKVGFKNLSQFNVIFKRKFGLTPGQYRKIHKK